MIVWLNETFGAGKTTTSGKLVADDHQSRHFDPESVAYMPTVLAPGHLTTDEFAASGWSGAL